MRCVTARVFPVLLLCVSSCFADEATKTEKIEEMLTLTNAERTIGQVFEQMKAIQMAQLDRMQVPPEKRQSLREMHQKVLKLLQDALTWDKLKPAIVKTYSDTFTEQEVDGILNFYKSPPGQAMLQKMPQLMQRNMAMTQQLLADITPQIEKLMQDMQKQAGQQR